jgi:transcriptional antiterminator RfaH
VKNLSTGASGFMNNFVAPKLCQQGHDVIGLDHLKGYQIDVSDHIDLRAMLNAANTHWYVLTSKPREEQRAYDNLTIQGHEVFLPKVAQVIKKKGVKTVALQPLFPSYLFIQLDKQVANFNAIRSTRGVGSFVRFGLNHAVISNGIIEDIKKSVASNKQGKSLAELFAYCQGDTVALTQGSLKGLKAIYQAKDGLERSVLMVKMLGQQSQVVVKNQDFEKVVN